MAELTPSRRSALLAQLLKDMERRTSHTGNRSIGEGALRVLGNVLQQRNINKLAKQEAEGQDQLSKALSKAVPGVDSTPLEAIVGDPNPPGEVTNVRRKGDMEAALAEVLQLPGQLRNQGLATLGAIKDSREPGFEQRVEIQTNATSRLNEEARAHQKALQEAGWEQQAAMADAQRAHQLNRDGQDFEYRKQLTAMDQDFKREMAQNDRLFTLELERLAKQGAEGLDLNDTQGKATAFAVRVENADMVLSAAGDEQTGFFDRAQGFIPTGMKGDRRQQFEQAERNLINALLRRESGAVISDEEFANARQQYIPQPGDSAATLEQKKLNRMEQLEGLKIQSGGGYEVLRQRVGTPDMSTWNKEEQLNTEGFSIATD